MNYLPRWKKILIERLAGNSPVMLNFCVLSKNLPNKRITLVLIPPPWQRNTAEHYAERAFLVPSECITDKSEDLSCHKIKIL